MKNDLMIKINDFTRECKKHNSLSRVMTLISYVPVEDLEDIEFINLYDSPPSHLPQDKSGSYYFPSYVSTGATIDIYVDRTLGDISHLPHRLSILKIISDKLFICLFGKVFLASCLFHEIGHHRYYLNQIEGSIDNEEDYANVYADRIIGNVYPLLPKFHSLVNKAYHLLYRKRIQFARAREMTNHYGNDLNP
jgi:hypothetical protein